VVIMTDFPPASSRPTVGVGIVIVKGHQIVMIRRGQPPRKGEWSIPGGHQELGETVREAAVREALEETGLTVGNLKLIDVVDAFGKHPDGSLRTQWTLDEIEGLSLWPETIRVIKAALAMA
jgi:8-oxo-dGTP diphosphatase